MSWNHRIVKKIEGREVYYEIHEAYYNDKGQLTAITEDPIIPYGDTIDEDYGLKWVLTKMLEACDNPVIDQDSVEFYPWDD